MFGLETLDVLIGLVTVYLAFGVACTATVEAITAWFSVRSSNLEAAMNEFLAGDLKPTETFVKAFYDHPLVQALSKGKDGRPSYIPTEIVGQVVELLVTANSTVESLAAAVNAMPGTPTTNRIKGLLDAFVTQAKGDVTAFRKAIEMHFNAVMDRVSGWFKRYAQNVALAVSAALVIGANADTLELATSLASSPEAQKTMVEIAEQQLKTAQATEKTAEDQVKEGKADAGITVEQAKRQTVAASAALERSASNIGSAGLGFGWKDYPKTLSQFLAKAAGLLVSILAVSLGAPFWFDVLQRFMQVRAAGILPREKKEEKK
jgi:hypothetical protein